MSVGNSNAHNGSHLIYIKDKGNMQSFLSLSRYDGVLRPCTNFVTRLCTCSMLHPGHPYWHSTFRMRSNESTEDPGTNFERKDYERTPDPVFDTRCLLYGYFKCSEGISFEAIWISRFLCVSTFLVEFGAGSTVV
uniref:Uncharacterized protein n=1 Tax=Schistocephalus solidus TaxID=70667 RepID=A0A0X3PI18_SCHSO